MNEKPHLSFWQIWNMSFGFLGIQFGWGLQMANMSSIYSFLGAKESQKLSLKYPSLTVESALSKKELTDPTDSLLVIFGQSGISFSGSCL